MQKLLYASLAILLLPSCQSNQETKKEAISLQGTWLLLSGTLIEKGDTAITDYTKNQKMIKIINEDHFSFLRHDLSNGKDSSAIFVAGGGTYTLAGDKYTENLEFCSAREWENNTFDFTIEIKNDTLVQQGIEKVAAANVDRINIEKYIRLKK